MFSWSSVRKDNVRYPNQVPLSHNGILIGTSTSTLNSRTETTPKPAFKQQGTVTSTVPDVNRQSSTANAIQQATYTRQQHLDSYCQEPTLRRSTRKVSQDDTTYDTVFQTTKGQTLILRVYVPLEGEKVSLFRGGILPQMSLVGVRATHDWFDARMKLIGYSPLQSDWEWNQCSLLLGSAVQDIVQHLQLNPPQIIEITNPDLARIQAKFPAQPSQPTHHVRRSNDDEAMMTNHANHNFQANHIQSSHIQKRDCSPPPNYNSWVHTEASVSAVAMPTIPTEYTDVLEDLSFDELQTLLTDQTALERLAETTEMFSELATMRRNALVQLEDNVTLAKELLEKEEESKELIIRVQDLKESLVQKLMKFDELSMQQDAFGVGMLSSSMHHQQQQQYQSIKHALKKERKKAFDESEAYATQWVESNDDEVPSAKPVSVSEFTNTFIKMRLAMHQRAAKLERLHHLTAVNAPTW